MFDIKCVFRKLRTHEKGAVIVTTALALTGLFFICSVAIDLGKYYLAGSQLQNVADSAALAGASVYVDQGTTQLVPLSSLEIKNNAFQIAIDGTTYTFQPYSDTTDPDNTAKDYVSINSDENLTLEGNGTTAAWSSKLTATMADDNTGSYTNAYCYRVDLTKQVDLLFARLFGLDKYPVSVSAMALVLPTRQTKPQDLEEFIKVVNANIFNTIPNYYWETIVDSAKDSFSVTNKNGAKATTGFGKRNPTYFTTDYSDYTNNGIAKVEKLTTGILAYSPTGEPIYGSNASNLEQLTYTLNSNLMKGFTNNKEITGLYLDRPNVSGNTLCRATVLNITGEVLSEDNDTPLYMRFESDPINVKGNLAFVQSTVINVKGQQAKPVVIAYDGPDPQRDVYCTPTIDSDGYTHSANNSYYQKTSTTISAPVTLNLEGGDFNGVLYAPNSTVIINGSGSINGFIMAAKVIDNTGRYGRTNTTAQSTIPTWGASYQSGHESTKGKFDYNVTTGTNNYTVVYDNFSNFTMKPTNITYSIDDDTTTGV